MTAPLSEWEREAKARLERSRARRDKQARRRDRWPLILFTLIILLAFAIVLGLNAIQGLH